MSKLLALDQASHTTGYAIFENQKLIHYGKFTLKDADLGVRLNKYRDKIKQIIKENNIDEVVFEDIQFQGKIEGQSKTEIESGIQNIQTFKILAEIFGVTYELLTELNIPNQAVLAKTWKSVLSIKGKYRSDQKKNAQKWVKDNYNLNLTEDECDAICIGAHLYHKDKSEDGFDWS